MSGYYSRLRDIRQDDQALQDCIEDVINRLESGVTTSDKPGMLLGKIQSGKTRGFLGIILRAFDHDYDIALVFTKGTKTLARQTVRRISSDFKDFIDEETISVYDIMEMPENMTRSEIKRKMVIVAKKEANNLARVIQLFNDHPSLKQRKVLLVDDEADMASVRFVKKKNSNKIEQGSIAQQMDTLRNVIERIAFLQVTATPYALYLQPEDYQSIPSNFVFFPKKPSFTSLLPIHSAYVGGNDYFDSHPSTDPRHYLYIEVPPEEHAALREADGRVIRKDRIWKSKSISVLRSAIMRFLIATVIRRTQNASNTRPSKFAMIIHNDTQKTAHKWQSQTVEWISDAFEDSASSSDTQLRKLFDECYEDLSRSVIANAGQIESAEEVYKKTTNLLLDGELNIQTVNSDVQLAPLLDPDTAELKLRTAANIFIGGSILDRGITIPHLISFYYGRNPKQMQADTVLQHSRMYGNRSKQDLAVTRFYTSDAVYQRLKRIHSLETTLRDAFESGANEQGVVFIQNNKSGGITPCAPNKVAASDVITVKPNSFYLPTSFDSKPSKTFSSSITAIDNLLDGIKPKSLVEIQLSTVLEIINLISETLTKPNDPGFEWNAMRALFRYYAEAQESKKVLLLLDNNRNLDRLSSGDKSGLSIIGTGLRPTLLGSARLEPALVLLKQNGTTDLNWSAGTPFWWPILATPTSGVPCVYSNATASVHP